MHHGVILKVAPHISVIERSIRPRGDVVLQLMSICGHTATLYLAKRQTATTACLRITVVSSCRAQTSRIWKRATDLNLTCVGGFGVLFYPYPVLAILSYAGNTGGLHYTRMAQKKRLHVEYNFEMRLVISNEDDF